MDLSAITGALGALRVAGEMANALVDIRDGQKLQSAVIELQSKILAAQSAAVTAQSQQMEMFEIIRTLRDQISVAEAWDRDAARYELIDFGDKSFAYRLKADDEIDPPHMICTNCFSARKKSILQFKYRQSDGREKFYCPSCQTEFHLGARSSSPAPSTRARMRSRSSIWE